MALTAVAFEPAPATGDGLPDIRADNATSDGLTLTPELQAKWNATQQRRELAMKLVAMRLDRGYSQLDLAQAMGKDQAFVSRMESATAPWPKAENIALYASHCERALAYAFLEKGEDELTLHSLVPVGQDRDTADVTTQVEDVTFQFG